MDHVDEATIVMNEVTQTTSEIIGQSILYAVGLTAIVMTFVFVYGLIKRELEYRKMG